jgi:hypothetical protein
MHPRGGRPTATHAFDPDAYDEVLGEQAHAWEDCHRNDDRGVTGETGR